MRIFLKAIIIAAAVTGAFWIFINNYITPQSFSLAEIQIKQDCQDTFNSALNQVLSDPGFSNLLDIEKDENGQIKSVVANSDRITNLQNKAYTYELSYLQSLNDRGISINTGAIISPITTGWGPDLIVTIRSKGNIQASYYTRFQTEGVNQTRIQVYIRLQQEMLLLLGLSTRDYQVSNDLLVADTILLGKIPQSYISGSQKNMIKLIPNKLVN